MSTLIKEHEGLIYDESFNENSLLWSLTPSNANCLSFTNNGLYIKHNEQYVTYTMKEMEGEYCLSTQIQHVPVTEEDIGGIIVFSDTNNYAECQTYLASAPSTIGNNGENINAGYDLSSRYVKYSFDDNDGSANPDASSLLENVPAEPPTGYASYRGLRFYCVSVPEKSKASRLNNIKFLIRQNINSVNSFSYLGGTITLKIKDTVLLDSSTPEQIADEINDIISDMDLTNVNLTLTSVTFRIEGEYDHNDTSPAVSTLNAGKDYIPPKTVVNENTGYQDKVYQYLKMIKYNNTIGHTYQFFASPDGFEWIEVGNVDYDRNNSIGFFLYATKNTHILRNGSFIVNSFFIYEQKEITIEGITILYDFEIIDTYFNQTILRSDRIGAPVSRYKNHVRINTTHLPLPWHNAVLRLYKKPNYDVTLAEYTMDNLTFGGDIFSINYDVQLRIDNEIIENGSVYDLGVLHKNDFKRNVVIHNNDDVDLSYITVSIKAFSEYYNGEEVVQIAIYDEEKRGPKTYVPVNEEDYLEGMNVLYKYSDKLLIPFLDAHSGIEIIMKLSDVPRQDFYSVANKYRFKLIIE